MSRFDSIVVGNDLVSEHWLAEQFPATVKTLRAEWKEREEHSKTTPRSGLIALSATFGAELVRLREDADADQFRALHAKVREALHIPGTEAGWSSERAGKEMAVPAVASSTPSGTHLLVLQARDAQTVEDLLDGAGAGHLLSPATMDGAEETSTAGVISGVFRTEEPPALVLVTAGGWLLLAERGSWPEGRWLAVDLATALERRDTKAAGELETIAALISSDSLLPGDDGNALLLTLLGESVRHAVGVSKDLRNGVRESIELLATEVLRRRRDRGLPSDEPGLAADLTRQALRYLYRILFLLYAEARPELGVLPVGTTEYAEGYGLDRLRELVLTDLTSAVAARGTHLYQSLGVLFGLVNDGYPPETLGPDGVVASPTDDEGGLRFEALRADLFNHAATALIDELGLGNRCLQQVLGRLLLSRQQRGRDRGFVSYAQLGINQLGAVYEGLMSYSGSIADDYMVEVAKDGDPSKGSWVVPVSSTEGFNERWFVQTTNPETGLNSRVTYAPGDFVFRLSGRDRQRSASYYTPEVLTRCVVTHSLAELLHDDTPAVDVLALRICEPALGSGAFLVEAINQLAAQYLKRRQAELGREIAPEAYPAELQKVKAYLALHNCYGVDLNATAVELAEITLWLDAMHPGLRAPWFGLHLRRGNSLIGGRRETYSPAHLANRAWLTTVPNSRPLGEPVPATEVHHFLMPAAGWGAVADTAEAKEGRPTATAALKAWRRAATVTLSKAEQTRLQALGCRVEALWALSLRRLEVAEGEIRRRIDVWGADDLAAGSGAVQREHIEKSLTDANSAYLRLRRVMDAWAALWFWPVTTSVAPPTREQWIASLEALLGITSKAEARGGRGLFADASWAELDEAEQNEVAFSRMRPVSELLDEHPWLTVCAQIAEQEGFFHWELDFASVFAAGGFDLQLGNPPWIPPAWDDPSVLADLNPWFVLAGAAPEKVSAQRKIELKKSSHSYLAERASAAGLSAYLGGATQWPRLASARTNLYRCFMDRTWRSMTSSGAVGLLHPDSHLTELRAGDFRKEVYRRTRRHWSFTNQLKLFEEIGNTRSFCVVVYGAPRAVQFDLATSLYHPDTIDRSVHHDGSGPEPGIKDENDQWDTRPHRSRVISVDSATLRSWAALSGELGEDDAAGAPLLSLPNRSSQNAVARLASAPRFGAIKFEHAQGWVEAGSQMRGHLVAKSARVRDWSDAVLQGPHLAVASPLFQEPNPTMKNHRDYSRIDLEQLADDFIPRTSFQRAMPQDEYLSHYPHWGLRPSNSYWRLAWRRRVDSEMARTLLAALLPIGPTHVEQVWSLTTEKLSNLAIAAGLWASLPLDFLVKVGGFNDVRDGVFRLFPHFEDHNLAPELVIRSLRLNCLTSAYAALWEELFDPVWQLDNWTSELPAVGIGEIGKVWTATTPLRRDLDRRQALVEIDALAAVMLGVTAEELCAIYRTQFGVLRKSERVMQFDANGRQVPRQVLKDVERLGSRASLGRYEHPFTWVDREAEMTVAHAEFTRRLAAR